MRRRVTNLVAACAALALCAGTASARALVLQPPGFTRDQMTAALADAPPFRFVYGTGDPATCAELRACARFVAERAFGADSTQVVADRDVDERALAAGPVFLFGTPRENDWTRRLAAVLPVQFEAAGFRWQGRLYDQPLDAIQLAYPNPLAPRRFLLLCAGNSPAALDRRAGFAFGDEDWRIVREGEPVRMGSFAQDGPRPWRYDAARDRDREAERDRFASTLHALATRGLTLRAPAGLVTAPGVSAEASSVLQRLDRLGLGAPPHAVSPTLTLYASLEQKGAMTRDTHSEHVVTDAGGRPAGAGGPAVAGGPAPAGTPAAHAGLPFGRDRLDLWSVVALRLAQLGGSARSRFFVPAAIHFAGRFEGEPLERALSRLYFGGVLPTASQAATFDGGWRSPIVWMPSRALLVRAIWECAPVATRRSALLALIRNDPPGEFAGLCRVSGVTPAGVERRYRVLADSLARVGRQGTTRRHPEPWRPAQGFQRGVCLAHAVGLNRGYLSSECALELERVRDAGANWVSVTPFAWLAEPANPELGNSSDGGPDGESDEAISEAAARAHALGLRVWLTPHVWTRGWAGALHFTPAGWQRFHAGYSEVLLHWALLAEREGMDGLFVGHELASSTAADPARWRALIGAVRRVYAGTLSYGANWDEVARVPFWDALDAIGVSFYAPLAGEPTRDGAALRAGAERELAALHALAVRFGRPVLLAEVGFPPLASAPVRPWEGPPGGLDLETQRACYEATVAAIAPCDWLAGALFWKWGSSARPGDDAFDARGKPAAAVVTRALRAWQGRPVRVPTRAP